METYSPKYYKSPAPEHKEILKSFLLILLDGQIKNNIFVVVRKAEKYFKITKEDIAGTVDTHPYFKDYGENEDTPFRIVLCIAELFEKYGDYEIVEYLLDRTNELINTSVGLKYYNDLNVFAIIGEIHDAISVYTIGHNALSNDNIDELKSICDEAKWATNDMLLVDDFCFSRTSDKLKYQDDDVSVFNCNHFKNYIKKREEELAAYCRLVFYDDTIEVNNVFSFIIKNLNQGYLAFVNNSVHIDTTPLNYLAQVDKYLPFEKLSDSILRSKSTLSSEALEAGFVRYLKVYVYGLFQMDGKVQTNLAQPRRVIDKVIVGREFVPTKAELLEAVYEVAVFLTINSVFSQYVIEEKKAKNKTF